MQIQSSTTHIVQPSKPSPAGTTIELSNNDQVMPRMYINMVYYFKNPKKEGESADGPNEFMGIEILKKALSETLSAFYPLAGRYVERPNGGLDIICSDQGVELIEVYVMGNFDVAFAGWQPSIAAQVVLPTVDWTNQPSITNTVLLRTQVTRFQGGRVALGVACHHHACDGPSVANFVGAWADIASGKGAPPTPMLDRSILKSQKEPKPVFEHVEYSLEPPVPPSSIPLMGAKMFEFGPDAVKDVKSRAGSSSFSSFEVIAGLVWKSVTKARGLDPTKEIKLGFAVDGRKRFDPPLPDNYFGNVNFYGLAKSTAGDLVSKPLEYAASLVHEAIGRITGEYMRSSLDWVEEKSSPLAVFPSFHSYLGPDFAITSWNRFPAYSVDFGWGTPEFFGVKDSMWDGLAIFLPSSSGEGINVLIGMTVEAMYNLQLDPEFH